MITTFSISPNSIASQIYFESFETLINSSYTFYNILKKSVLKKKEIDWKHFLIQEFSIVVLSKLYYIKEIIPTYKYCNELFMSLHLTFFEY